MPRPSIVIHDAATGDTVTREMTDDEYAQYEADQAAYAAAKAADEAEAQAKATARQALLDRLGITEAEAVLLLGG
jgi:hypothetical protein